MTVVCSLQKGEYSKREVKPSCDVKVDVGFVLDSSGSLKDDYGKEKSFLKALAATFGVSEQGARAGVVTFSFDAEHSVKLNDHYDLASFNDAVDNIPLMGYTTRIDKALRLTQSQMFSIANGGRPGVSKVVVLLTDGSQTQDAGAENPAVVAEELRSQGYKVLAVGIGGGVNSTELAPITGAQSNVFSAATFDELISQEFLDKLNQAGCKEAKREVNQAVTSKLIEQGARAGVVTFSFDAEHSVKLNDHYDLARFNDAVDNIPLMGYTTRIDKALRLTQSQMFSIANGGRPGVSKVVVLLTDGSQTQDAGAENPAVVAEELRSQGYKVLAVGIGGWRQQYRVGSHYWCSIKCVFCSDFSTSLSVKNFWTNSTKAGCKEAKREVKPSCDVKVDVGFVLDSSGSLKDDYGKEKSFLKALAATFGVSEQGARAGVVTFSFDAEHSVKLNDRLRFGELQ
ncbi:collagen alpha-6(VI) chain-like [Clytia hemisphaerica]|uniref:collagen alpha-6(VI) chain-like n=1 Tax=Clytia hemisphaerica TaxID=252671 RepID=UPI0034D794B5